MKEIELEVKKQLDILVTKKKSSRSNWSNGDWSRRGLAHQKSPKTVTRLEADLMKVLEAEAAKNFRLSSIKNGWLRN